MNPAQNESCGYRIEFRFKMSSNEDLDELLLQLVIREEEANSDKYMHLELKE